MELNSFIQRNSSEVNYVEEKSDLNPTVHVSAATKNGSNEDLSIKSCERELECNKQEKMLFYTSCNKSSDSNQSKKNSKITLQKDKSLKLTKPLRENQYIKRYKLRTKTVSDIVGVSSLNLKSGCKSTKFFKKAQVVNHKLQGSKIKCSYCKKVFTSDSSFFEHVEQCNNKVSKLKKNNNFEMCKETFCDNNLKNNNSEGAGLKCQNCNEIFMEKIKFKEHVKNECRNLKSFTCDLCKATFNNMGYLKKHIIAHLNPSSSHKINDSKYVSQETLGSPLNGKKLLTKNVCNFCKKIFKSKTSFQNHLKTHQNNIVKCEKCLEVFVDSMKFSSHVSECQKPDGSKQKFECDICGQKFLKFNHLKSHILSIHQGINDQCEKCGLKFTNKDQHDIHISKNECKPEEPSTCKICNKVFLKKDYLKKHQYVHTNVLFKCKYCYCGFMKEKNFKKHIEKMNCSKSARKIRMAEYNFKKCRICEVEFENENLLIDHFKTSHSGQNPHQCFCCESSLPTFQDLQDHIHQHNIQKYTCSICGKPYTSQEGFRKHRLKHKGAEYKCKFCCAEFLNENRYKFHEKNCKKNPECGNDQSSFKEKSKKKDLKPKQSRQLNWESRIIVKHLRADPKVPSENQNTFEKKNENSFSSTFFDKTETDIVNRRGWFDNYYKTDEDDIAFGLKRDNEAENQNFDSEPDVDDFFHSNSNTNKKNKNSSITSHKERNHVVENFENDDIKNYSEGYSSESSSSSSSEEENLDEIDQTIDYNPKKCRLCVLSFGQEYELLHHFIKNHPGEHAHKCPHCEVQSPLFAQLKEHMKTHGIGMGIFNCDNCSKKFKSEKKMKSHNIRCKGLNLESGSTKKLLLKGEEHCKKCKKKFQTKFGYKRHKQLCKGKTIKTKKINSGSEISNKPKENFINCDNDVENPDVSDLNEDFVEIEKGNHGSDRSDVLMISSSIEPLPDKTDFSKDGQTEEKKKDIYIGEPPLDSFPCRLCEKKFQYERGIVMHFKSAHPGHKPLICPVCNMHLADKLKEHLKTHGIGEEFICGLCGKRFNQKFLSKIHEMWHEGIEYKCSNCKQKFLNKEKMEKHISESRCSNRQSLMRLPCDICGKSYRSKFGLSKHYITHTPKELRPIKNKMNCEYCGKWFENNNGLQRHRRIHTGERPFCCRYCPKAFAQEGNCKAHERIHTGESKPRKKKLLKETTPRDIPPPTPQPQTQLVPAIIVPQTTVTSNGTAETIFYPGHINLYIYTGIDTNGIVH